MRELAKSFASFSWAVSLAGVQQLAGVMKPGAAGRGRAGDAPARAALDEITRAAQEQLGDVVSSVFESADQVQRQAIDRLFRGEAAGVGADCLATSADAARCLVPGRDGLAAWRELSNKLEVFWLVRAWEPRQAKVAGAAWSELVARAYRLAPFAALFELEGLGHDLVDAAWETGGGGRAGEPPAIAGALGSLPAESWIMLHAGMGMSLARRLVRPIRPETPEAAVDTALDELVALCRASSVPGYFEAAIEPLGLVVHTFQPKTLELIERRLRRLDPKLAGFFWHGVGRAAYFLPVHFFPGAARRAAEACRRLAPDAASRLDALHGLAYAAAMTNLRHPEVVESLLRQIGEREGEEEAFTAGVVAALIARRDTTPGDPAIAAFLAHRPADRAAAWEQRIAVPAARGLDVLYPRLKAQRRLGELGRHRPLDELVEEAR